MTLPAVVASTWLIPLARSSVKLVLVPSPPADTSAPRSFSSDLALSAASVSLIGRVGKASSTSSVGQAQHVLERSTELR